MDNLTADSVIVELTEKTAAQKDLRDFESENAELATQQVKALLRVFQRLPTRILERIRARRRKFAGRGGRKISVTKAAKYQVLKSEKSFLVYSSFHRRQYDLLKLITATTFDDVSDSNQISGNIKEKGNVNELCHLCYAL